MTPTNTPLDLNVPSFLLNFPFSLSVKNPNNPWMKKGTRINKETAYVQWLSLYNLLASEGLVYILPSDMRFQDQVYATNLGLTLFHMKEKPTIILSHFRTPPRKGEELVGQKFLPLMNYNTVIAPHEWEGEAETKYLRENIYFGGHGIRSDIKVYDWMEKKFNMKIIRLEEKDEKLYHLDTTLFQLDKKTILLCTELYNKKEIDKVKQVAEIISVNKDVCYAGICNCVRFGDMILCHSDIDELDPNDPDYDIEKEKIEILERICAKRGLELVLLNISEYLKSGALLSCLVMHLNWVK
ncbi:MAG: arginine deiminase-related protein [Nanoarchaeota archaeon]